MSYQSNKDEAPPALYLHCVATYDKMFESAKPLSQNSNVIVYEGYLTTLIQSDLSLSVPYYTSIRNKLMEMGCIKQLKRGGGTSPSQWEMITAPTLLKYEEATPSKIPKQTKQDATNQQILALSKRLTKVENDIKSIIGWMETQLGSNKQ